MIKIGFTLETFFIFPEKLLMASTKSLSENYPANRRKTTMACALAKIKHAKIPVNRTLTIKELKPSSTNHPSQIPYTFVVDFVNSKRRKTHSEIRQY